MTVDVPFPPHCSCPRTRSQCFGAGCRRVVAPSAGNFIPHSVKQRASGVPFPRTPLMPTDALPLLRRGLPKDGCSKRGQLHSAYRQATCKRCAIPPRTAHAHGRADNASAWAAMSSSANSSAPLRIYSIAAALRPLPVPSLPFHPQRHTKRRAPPCAQPWQGAPL